MSNWMIKFFFDGMIMSLTVALAALATLLMGT
jgi:hypothetical protein